MKNQEIFYHWYEEPEHSIVETDKEKLKRLVPKLPKLWFLSYKKNTVRVGSLKELCAIASIGYDELETKDIVSINDGIKFPIKLDVPEFAILIAATTNEGHLETGKHLFEYYNKDLILHKIVRICILKIFGKVTKFPKVRGNALRTYSYGIVPRVLCKSGVTKGAKALVNGTLPSILKGNQDMIKQYFSHLLMEEMSTYFRFKKGKYLSLCIRYGRSVDITDKLPKKFKNKINRGEQIRFKSLPHKIKDIIKTNPPLLIMEEKELLNSFGINSFLTPSFIYKIKKKNYIRTHWILLTDIKKSVELFYENFSYSKSLEDTPIKMREFLEKFEIWKKYRGRKLNEKEIMLIKDVNREWQKIKKGGVLAA